MGTRTCLLPVDTSYGPWVVTHKTDQDCRLLADRHYSRQTVGAAQFTRPGHNLVLRTLNGDAVWVTWRSNHPRKDGYDAWECTIFRNESGHQSSDLIRYAIYATLSEWRHVPLPEDGLLTYVDESKVQGQFPGYCFLRSGFRRSGFSTARSLMRYLTDLSLAHQEYEAYNTYKWCQEWVSSVLEGGEVMELEWVLENIEEAEKQFIALTRKRKAKRHCLHFSLFNDGEIGEMYRLIKDHI